MKLITHAIDKLETDFFMTKITAISSVENTINKSHIQYDLHLIYKKNFSHDKESEMNNCFDR